VEIDSGRGTRQGSSIAPARITRLATAKYGCRLGVGGEERFDREFGDGDVERRAEGGHGTEEDEFAAIVADAQRYDDVAGPGRVDLGFGLVARVGTQLVQETGEIGVRGQGDLATKATEQMRPPLAQVRDPGRHAFGVEAYP
jgi:hypothetical protein